MRMRMLTALLPISLSHSGRQRELERKGRGTYERNYDSAAGTSSTSGVSSAAPEGKGAAEAPAVRDTDSGWSGKRRGRIGTRWE
jgi:hypothetical protein